MKHIIDFFKPKPMRPLEPVPMDKMDHHELIDIIAKQRRLLKEQSELILTLNTDKRDLIKQNSLLMLQLETYEREVLKRA